MIYIEIVVYNSVSEMWVRLRVHHIGFTKLNNENKLFQRYHKDYGRRDGEGEIIFRHSILGKLFDVREGVLKKKVLIIRRSPRYESRYRIRV